MNQYKIMINGQDLSWWNHQNQVISDGTSDWWINYPSGSFVDPYRYPARPQNEERDLWKCVGCGAVYWVKDTLECEHCGLFITEKSRFKLE